VEFRRTQRKAATAFLGGRHLVSGRQLPRFGSENISHLLSGVEPFQIANQVHWQSLSSCRGAGGVVVVFSVGYVEVTGMRTKSKELKTAFERLMTGSLNCRESSILGCTPLFVAYPDQAALHTATLRDAIPHIVSSSVQKQDNFGRRIQALEISSIGRGVGNCGR